MNVRVFINGTDSLPQPLLSHKTGMGLTTVQAKGNYLNHVVKEDLGGAKTSNTLC